MLMILEKMRNSHFQLTLFMKITFPILLIGSLVLTACSYTIPDLQTFGKDELIFEDSEIGIRLRYPAELTVELTGEELAGFDRGKKMGYSFSGEIEGVEVSFGLSATTADFGFGISEGCCWAFGGPAVDLSQSDDEIKNDLARGVNNENDAENWKLLEIYNLERITLGTYEFLHFADMDGYIGYFLNDSYFVPHPNHEFTNIMITWRSSELFTNYEKERTEEEFFSYIESSSVDWMNDLTESEEKEKAVVEKILSTLEFIE